MLIHDVSLQHLHAVFGLDRAGIVGSDGETHHGIFDIAYLRSVPGMQILCPASFSEMHDYLERALFHMDGPVALRYPRGGEGEYRASSEGDEQILRQGADLTIICYGTMVNEALSAARQLEQKGISAEVVKINRLGPEDYSVTLSSLEKTGALLASEEVCASGCVGEQILSQAAVHGITLRGARLLNLGCGIVAHGSRDLLMRDQGIDAAAMTEAGMALAGKAE